MVSSSMGLILAALAMLLAAGSDARAIAEGPLFLDIAQGTGTHFVDFNYNRKYSLGVSAQPGSSKLSLDISNNDYPKFVLQATESKVGDLGLGTVVIFDGQNILCTAQVQFRVQSASCSGSSNSGGDTVVIPPGPVYINPAYPTTVINQYNTVYNVQVNTNINAVSCTCCYGSCNNYYNNTYVNPGSPPTPNTPPQCGDIPTPGCVYYQDSPRQLPPRGQPPSSSVPPTQSVPPATSVPPTRSVPPTTAVPPTRGVPPTSATPQTTVPSFTTRPLTPPSRAPQLGFSG